MRNAVEQRREGDAAGDAFQRGRAGGVLHDEDLVGEGFAKFAHEIERALLASGVAGAIGGSHAVFEEFEIIEIEAVDALSDQPRRDIRDDELAVRRVGRVHPGLIAVAVVASQMRGVIAAAGDEAGGGMVPISAKALAGAEIEITDDAVLAAGFERGDLRGRDVALIGIGVDIDESEGVRHASEVEAGDVAVVADPRGADTDIAPGRCGDGRARRCGRLRRRHVCREGEEGEEGGKGGKGGKGEKWARNAAQP